MGLFGWGRKAEPTGEAPPPPPPPAAMAADRAEEIDLAPFCEDQEGLRLNLMQPFSQGDYTYASDGLVLIRVPRREGVEEGGPKLDKILPALEKALAERTFGPLPAYDAIPEKRPAKKTCKDCNGSGRVKNCAKCEGTGSAKCPTCGQDEADCGECEGQGWFPAAEGEEGENISDCDNCGGEGEVEVGVETPALARFADAEDALPQHDYQLRFIECLKALPGVEVAFAGRHVPFGSAHSALAYRFDGGAGLVMPRSRQKDEGKA